VPLFKREERCKQPTTKGLKMDKTREIFIKSGNGPLVSFSISGSLTCAAIFAFQDEFKEHARIEFNLEEGEKLLKDLARIVNVMRAESEFKKVNC